MFNGQGTVLSIWHAVSYLILATVIFSILQVKRCKFRQVRIFMSRSDIRQGFKSRLTLVGLLTIVLYHLSSPTLCNFAEQMED